MKKIITVLFMLTVLFSWTSTTVTAQESTEKSDEKAYVFEMVKEIPHTAVRNQYRSGTCWSFSGLSLIEAEILRTKGVEMDLSEMFVVHNVYSEKVKKYVRLHGNINLSAGGGFSDVIMSIRDYGIIPETNYSGLVIGEEKHVHGEMDEVIKAYADAVIKNRNQKLSPVWFNGFESVLDAYLGAIPKNFEVDGKSYTPISFAASTSINPDDYVELTSFTHQPFYKPFIIEIPDNWMWSDVYNLPLDEMMQTIDHALENGYSVAWAADVSEKGFSWKNGLAVVPEESRQDLSGTEKERWEALTPAEKQKAMYAFDTYIPEKKISAEMRQQGYDNYQTTDDHGMHIVGIAKDQRGNKFYKVKNSWGTEGHTYEGYLYVSVPFVQYKTISVMMHKNAIPKNIRKLLAL